MLQVVVPVKREKWEGIPKNIRETSQRTRRLRDNQANHVHLMWDESLMLSFSYVFFSFFLRIREDTTECLSVWISFSLLKTSEGQWQKKDTSPQFSVSRYLFLYYLQRDRGARFMFAMFHFFIAQVSLQRHSSPRFSLIKSSKSLNGKQGREKRSHA